MTPREFTINLLIFFSMLAIGAAVLYYRHERPLPEQYCAIHHDSGCPADSAGQRKPAGVAATSGAAVTN